MTTLPNWSYMTVEEYLELDRNSIDTRYEYDNGRVYMMAGGSIDHATIGGNIFSFLRNVLRGKSCRALNSDPRVRVSENRYVHPDVTVTCDEQDRGSIDIVVSPRVVIEVLSPSTEIIDRREKLQWYQNYPTIQEYVLINTYIQLAELYRREKNGLWSFLTFKPDNDIQFTSINVRIPMAVVYEDVVFPDTDNPSSA